MLVCGYTAQADFSLSVQGGLSSSSAPCHRQVLTKASPHCNDQYLHQKDPLGRTEKLTGQRGRGEKKAQAGSLFMIYQRANAGISPLKRERDPPLV